MSFFGTENVLIYAKFFETRRDCVPHIFLS